MTPTIGKEFGSERDVPTWNGIEEGWNGYIEEVEWYFWATAPKDRHLVASRLARRLTGSARNAIRGLRPRDFAGTQGITRLLQILQSRIGDLPIPDLANKLDEFIFRLKRGAGESMNEWGLRSIESYRKLQVALDRVKGKQVDLGDYEYDHDAETSKRRGFPWPPEWGNQSHEDWDEPEEADAEEEEFPFEEAPPTSATGARRGKHGAPRGEATEPAEIRECPL